jgi:hypothetical protein
MRSSVLPALLMLVAIPAWSQDQLLTHSTDFARVEPSQWRAEAWRVENPDPGATVVEVDGVLAFVVTEPNRSMAWTLTTEPVWMDPFATLAASYFIEGGVAKDGLPSFELFDGSTGPITPGATNMENPLASGGRYACGVSSEGLHIEVVDLSAVENLERVAEITITVRSADEPVVLRLNQLAFLADPVVARAAEVPPWSPIKEGGVAFGPLELPREGAVSHDALVRALGISSEWLAVERGHIGGLPFTLGGHGAATPLLGGGSISLDGAGSGNTLALLCATRLWGSGQAWYSKNSSTPRRNAPRAHHLLATFTYTDGTTTQAIPERSDGLAPGLSPGVGAYTVPVDENRELARVFLEEDMSFGQVVLLAASRLDSDSTVAQLTRVRPGPATTTVAYVESEDTLIMEGAALRLSMDRQGVVQSLQLGEHRHEVLSEPFPLVNLTDGERNDLPLTFVDALRVPDKNRMAILWQVGGEERRCELSMTLRADGGLECVVTLTNPGETSWKLAATVPRLSGLRVARDGIPAYVLGGRSAIIDSAPIELEEVYGGRYPNQFMDVYDNALGGGLAYIVEDDTLARKWFEFKQDEDGRTTMAVSYRHLEVPPGESHRLPPVVLLPHDGDWRGPFKSYRSWVRRAFPRARDNAMADVFYCRRDYPLGGTSYLYDVAKPGYSFEKLISESRWAFGGVDMVDISGWAYNEDVGRVGTYRSNDLGGLAELAKGTWQSHTRNVKVGLYFEGYLLDKRASNAERGLAEWQLIRAGNKPAWWPSEMEFFCCPGAKGWQVALAEDIAEVAKVTKADAVYVDQLGICDVSKECWAANHDHPVPSNPIKTEIAMLERIRTELDKVRPECAIYIEHIPCDAMTRHIDGAFNMGMKHTRHPLGPTKLPLHRYLHPEVPIFEMVAHGIRPIPAEEDDLKLAFFHGMGLWLKGKGASWYSEGFREQANAFYPIFTKYSRFFRSLDAEPHVDTLADGVYANRFPYDGNELYTLYNANSETKSGALLALPDADGAAITSLVEGVLLTLDTVEAGTVLIGDLPPQGVAGVVVNRK